MGNKSYEKYAKVVKSGQIVLAEYCERWTNDFENNQKVLKGVKIKVVTLGQNCKK